MPKIAVMEDDVPTSDAFCGWLSEVPGAEVVRYLSREAAERALGTERFDLIILDIEFGIERHAGIGMMRIINRLDPSPPILVITGLPAEELRGVTKELGAWDFLSKPCKRHDLVLTVLEVFRNGSKVDRIEATNLILDPLNRSDARWRGQKVNLTMTEMRIVHRLVASKDSAVTYLQLYDAVKTGKTEETIRKHISTIRSAFRAVDPDFQKIKSIPLVGFMWLS